MRRFACFFAVTLFAQDDSKLPIHTLVREDIFAGLLSGDMERSARGYEKLQALKKSRPADLPEIQAWESSVLGLRAANAFKEGKTNDANELLDQAVKLQNEALAKAPKSVGVIAVVGGTWVTIADRFPSEQSKPLWQTTLAMYKSLLKMQESILPKLPLHNRGELLTGIVQAAQRAGDTATFDKYFPVAQESLKGTSYGALLARWASEPALRDRTNISCKSCHDPGKLENVR